MSGPAEAGAWPDGAFEALDQWRQGHIVDGVPIVVVGAPAGATPLWADAAPTGLELAGNPVLAESNPMLRRAMVVSQACELIKSNFPVATVVPVYDATDMLSDQQKATVRGGKTWHLVHLSAGWTGDRFWVADLRIEFAVDKMHLVVKAPVEAFEEDVLYARLAERLAVLRQRAAVPQPTTDLVINPLRTHMATRREGGATPLRGVREVRVQSNHHTSPTSATLFVIAETAAADIDAAEWQAAVDAIQPEAAAQGLALVGPELTTLWDMTAADYLTSQPIADADSS